MNRSKNRSLKPLARVVTLTMIALLVVCARSYSQCAVPGAGSSTVPPTATYCSNNNELGANVLVVNAVSGRTYVVRENGAFRSSQQASSYTLTFGPYPTGTYHVYIVDNCGLEDQIGTCTISVLPPPSGGSVNPSRSLSQQFCASNPDSLTFNVSGASAPYQWLIDGNAYNVAQGATLTYPFDHAAYGIPGTHNVSVTYHLSNACYTSYPITVSNMPVTIIANPVISASDAVICSGSTGNVNVGIVSLDPPSAALQLNWTVDQAGVTGASNGSNTYSASAISQQLTATGSMPGTATYHITPSVAGCAGPTVNAQISVRPNVTPTNPFVGNTTVCPNAQGEIFVQNTGTDTQYEYRVRSSGALLSAKNASTTGSLTFGPYNPGVYQVYFYNTVCQSELLVGTSTISLTTEQPPSGSATPSRPFSDAFCDSNPGTLKIIAGTASQGSYEWRIDGNIYDVGQTDTLIYPFDHPVYGIPGTHNISVSYRVNGGTCYPNHLVTVSNMPVNIVDPVGNITVSRSGPVKVCSTCTQVFNATTGSGFSYQWLRDNNPVGTNQSSLTVSESGLYKVVITKLGCSKPSDTLRLIRNIAPSVSVGTDQLLMLANDATTIAGSFSDADGTIVSSNWTQTTGPRSTMAVDGANLNVTYLEAGINTFRLIATDDSGDVSFDDVVVEVQAPPNNYSWIKETTVLKKDQKSLAEVANLQIADGDKSLNWNYFDGLGRPMQSIAVQGSPNAKDIVQPVVYDQFNREKSKYLPVVPNESNGLYKPNNALIDATTGDYTSIALNFYNNGSIADDNNKPFAETVFEPSPLSRVIKQGAPGAPWQPDAVNTYASTDHTVKKSYETNSAGEVFLFRYNTDTELISLYPGVGNRYYVANALMANKTKDEHNNEVIEYIDKEGRTVCKKVQYETVNNVKKYASTYYIYDDFGNLVAVLPPEGVRELLSHYNLN